MRGHEQLIAMRRKGYRPHLVFIHCGQDASGMHDDWHRWDAQQAHVTVADDELLSSLDLRFVVGLPVVITGDDERRISSVFDACVACEARRVMTTTRDSATEEATA